MLLNTVIQLLLVILIATEIRNANGEVGKEVLQGLPLLTHVPLPTFPIEPEFNKYKKQNQGAEYSWSHCFSSSLQADGWRSTSCFFKNLCFNSTAKEFIFYAKDQMHLPDPVSIGTFNYKWGVQYDEVVRYTPKIVYSPLPEERFEASANELWIPFLPFCPANIGHLVWDDYLTLYMLSWAAKPFIEGDFSLRPFWYNPPENPPWATCDWIRLHEGPDHSLPSGYSNRCLKNNKKWLPQLTGEGNEVIPETTTFAPKQANGKLICFPHGGYGITPFANQASGHHGWSPNDPIAPSFGRAPMMFQFTRLMMKRMHVEDWHPRTLNEIIVFFSSRSSDRISIDFGRNVRAMNEKLPEIQRIVNHVIGHDRLRVVVKHEVLADLSGVDQMKLASSACVYVTAAGGGAFTAQFLPKGSSIILYHHASGEHLHKGRVDWKVFNAASWMRSTYLDHTEAGDIEKLTAMISQEILNCVFFMDALNV